MLVCEVAAECKAEGKTLYDRLAELYEKYGYYLEGLETKTLTGIDGRKQIDAIMDKFRTGTLTFEVKEVKDYSKGIDGLPKSNVLKFFLSDDSWFAVRPSGTEPKIKFYFGVAATSLKNAELQLDNLKKAVLNFMV